MEPTFLQRLSRTIREAVAWCEPRADAKSTAACLRSLPYRLYPFGSRENLADDVVMERFRRLGTRTYSGDIPPDEPAITLSELRGGRVLAVLVDLYLHEAWEQDESNGYVDADLTPPTDTWLAFVESAVVPNCSRPTGLLLAFVPSVFVAPVQLAMNINTTDCIKWLEDLGGDLSDHYRVALGVARAT